MDKELDGELLEAYINFSYYYKNNQPLSAFSTVKLHFPRTQIWPATWTTKQKWHFTNMGGT